jgi:uncharacterized protein YcbK (DUF882 family)
VDPLRKIKEELQVEREAVISNYRSPTTERERESWMKNMSLDLTKTYQGAARGKRP